MFWVRHSKGVSPVLQISGGTPVALETSWWQPLFPISQPVGQDPMICLVRISSCTDDAVGKIPRDDVEDRAYQGVEFVGPHRLDSIELRNDSGNYFVACASEWPPRGDAREVLKLGSHGLGGLGTAQMGKRGRNKLVLKSFAVEERIGQIYKI